MFLFEIMYKILKKPSYHTLLHLKEVKSLHENIGMFIMSSKESEVFLLS